jgi:hypothetical protein
MRLVHNGLQSYTILEIKESGFLLDRAKFFVASMATGI